MKKTTKILCLVLILMSCSLIDAYSSVIVTIKLARHRDCKGFGWCYAKIVIEPDDIKPEGNIGIGDASITDDGRLQVTFNPSTGLTPEALETYFSKDEFLFEDDFPVPSEILEALKYPYEYTIKEGTYSIERKGELITVLF